MLGPQADRRGTFPANDPPRSRRDCGVAISQRPSVGSRRIFARWTLPIRCRRERNGSLNHRRLRAEPKPVTRHHVRVVLGQAHEHANAAHSIHLLRTRSEWPNNQARKQFDEFAPPHVPLKDNHNGASGQQRTYCQSIPRYLENHSGLCRARLYNLCLL